MSAQPSDEAPPRGVKDLNKYPTIAFSDGVNAACCLWSAQTALGKGRADVAAGMGLVALASGIGSLRFGLSPRTFAPANELVAQYAGRVGIPLIGIGFARARGLWPELLGAGEGFPTPVATALAAGAALSRLPLFGRTAQELYVAAMGVASMVCLLYAEGGMQNREAVYAVGTFIFAGLVVGNERHKRILGVRREDIFHYMLGSSMIMFARALK